MSRILNMTHPHPTKGTFAPSNIIRQYLNSYVNFSTQKNEGVLKPFFC